MSNQDAKFDGGKAQLTLVPTQIFFDIARIREYGVKKYKDPENWKRVEIERYRDAMYRHWLAYVNDPHGLDEESGMPHLWHVACNCAFLCEMEKGKYDKKEETCNINGKQVAFNNDIVHIPFTQDELGFLVKSLSSDGIIADKDKLDKLVKKLNVRRLDDEL